MRYPEFLKKNGCIGFVAPSFGCNIEPYKTAFGHALDKRNWDQTVTKDAASVSVTRRRSADRN